MVLSADTSHFSCTFNQIQTQGVFYLTAHIHKAAAEVELERLTTILESGVYQIRKFIMTAFASGTSESLDDQIIPATAFMFSDTKSGFAVSELSATARTSWYIFIALLTQNTVRLVANKHILCYNLLGKDQIQG